VIQVLTRTQKKDYASKTLLVILAKLAVFLLLWH